MTDEERDIQARQAIEMNELEKRHASLWRQLAEKTDKNLREATSGEAKNAHHHNFQRAEAEMLARQSEERQKLEKRHFSELEVYQRKQPKEQVAERTQPEKLLAEEAELLSQTIEQVAEEERAATVNWHQQQEREYHGASGLTREQIDEAEKQYQKERQQRIAKIFDNAEKNKLKKENPVDETGQFYNKMLEQYKNKNTFKY